MKQKISPLLYYVDYSMRNERSVVLIPKYNGYEPKLFVFEIKVKGKTKNPICQYPKSGIFQKALKSH